MRPYSRYLGQLALGLIIAALAGLVYAAKLFWEWLRN